MDYFPSFFPYKFFFKSFLSKIFKRSSDENVWRSLEEWDFTMILCEDLRKISFFGRSQKRFGSWVVSIFSIIHFFELKYLLNLSYLIFFIFFNLEEKPRGLERFPRASSSEEWHPRGQKISGFLDSRGSNLFLEDQKSRDFLPSR